MKLLRDPNVASSGKLVLAHMTPVKTEADHIAEKRVVLVKTRTQSWGDQKLVESMVPGYKGMFLPIHKVYSKTCHLRPPSYTTTFHL